MSEQETFDVVIVGGGIARCVAAARAGELGGVGGLIEAGVQGLVAAEDIAKTIKA